MPSIQIHPWKIFTDIWPYRYLLGQMVYRDVLIRYRGAMFGVAWMFLSPLFMLLVFAFVFGQIFQARWAVPDSRAPFWILLYAGLIPFNLFAEAVSRAPAAVRSYPSYVKKIVFPVQLLPLVPLGSALVHGCFHFALMLGAMAVLGTLHANILLFPVLLLPALLLTVGVSWFTAAWGVFIKDMSQIVPIAVQALLFLSPVFYPVEAVPAPLHPLYALNPLGAVIEACRALVAEQSLPWAAWLRALALCWIVAILGYAFFRRSREEFADAL